MKTPLPQVAQKRVLGDWVADSIREAILAGHFQPAEKLDQGLIAQELGVSRTPIREAIAKLESEGFVEVRAHYGAFITMVSREDISDVFEILQILEPEIVRQVTPMIPQSHFKEIDLMLNHVYLDLKQRDIDSYFQGDFHFLESILEYVPNKLLKELMRDLSHRMGLIRRFAQIQPESYLTQSLEEHRSILEAMQNGNCEKAVKLTKKHLKRSANRLLSSLEDNQLLRMNE